MYAKLILNFILSMCKMSLEYAVKAQTSLAPLSWFHGSRVTTAHAHQCCIFQSYAKTVPSRMKLTMREPTFMGSMTTDTWSRRVTSDFNSVYKLNMYYGENAPLRLIDLVVLPISINLRFNSFDKIFVLNIMIISHDTVRYRARSYMFSVHNPGKMFSEHVLGTRAFILRALWNVVGTHSFRLKMARISVCAVWRIVYTLRNVWGHFDVHSPCW